MARMQSSSLFWQTAPDSPRMPAVVNVKLLSLTQLESGDYPDYSEYAKTYSEYSKTDRVTDGLKAPYYLVIEQDEQQSLSQPLSKHCMPLRFDPASVRVDASGIGAFSVRGDLDSAQREHPVLPFEIRERNQPSGFNIDTRLADTHPANTHPANTHSVDINPVNTDPADAQPVVSGVSGPDNDTVVEVPTASGCLRFGVTKTGDIALQSVPENLTLTIKADGVVSHQCNSRWSALTVQAKSFVNERGRSLSADTLELQCAEQAVNEGRLQTTQNLSVAARDIRNAGVVTGGGDVRLDADTVENTKDIQADGMLTVTAAAAFANTEGSTLKAERGVTVAAKTLENGGTIEGLDVQLNAARALENLSSGSILARGKCLASAGIVSNAGQIKAGGAAKVVAVERLEHKAGAECVAGKRCVQQAPVVQNHGIVKGQAVSIRSRTFQNGRTGKAFSGGKLALQCTDGRNNGALQGGTVAVEARGDFVNTNLLLAKNSVTVTADKLLNTGMASGSQGVTLNGRTVMNRGMSYRLRPVPKGVTSEAHVRATNRAVFVKLKDPVNGFKVLYKDCADGEVKHFIVQSEPLAQAWANKRHAPTVSRALRPLLQTIAERGGYVSGMVKTAGAVNVKAGTFKNEGAGMLQGAQVRLTASQSKNHGVIASSGAVNVTAGTFKNQDTGMLQGAQVRLTAGQSKNHGVIASSQATALKTRHGFENHATGTVVTQGHLSSRSAQVVNHGELLARTATLQRTPGSLAAVTLKNAGGVIAVEQKCVLQQGSVQNTLSPNGSPHAQRPGVITAGVLEGRITGRLNNQHGVVRVNHSADLDIRGDLQNTQGAIVQNGLRSPDTPSSIHDSLDADGYTPLHRAVLDNNLERVKALLDVGANPNIAGLHHRTVLQTAAFQGNTELAALLIRYNANPEQRDDSGLSAMDFVVQAGHSKIVQLFKTGLAGPNLAAEYERQSQMLQGQLQAANVHLKAEEQRLREQAVAKRAQLAQVVSACETAVTQARVMRWRRVVREAPQSLQDDLSRAKAELEAANAQPLEQAIAVGLAEPCASVERLTTQLKQLHANHFANLAVIDDIDSLDSDGYTPLHRAVMENNQERAQTLLSLGANPNITNINGHTALYMAARHGFTDMADLLLRQNASPVCAPVEGIETGVAAAALAKQAGHPELARMLTPGATAGSLPAAPAAPRPGIWIKTRGNVHCTAGGEISAQQGQVWIKGTGTRELETQRVMVDDSSRIGGAAATRIEGFRRIRFAGPATGNVIAMHARDIQLQGGVASEGSARMTQTRGKSGLPDNLMLYG